MGADTGSVSVEITSYWVRQWHSKRNEHNNIGLHSVVTKKLLIVGNGVAAWLAAARLSSTLNRDGRDFADIGVLHCAEEQVESEAYATLPEIQQLLAALGVKEFEFMRRVQGTFRQSTKFVNWLRNEDEYFHHPLTLERPGAVDQAGRRWLASNRSVPFVDTVSIQPMVCEMNLAPKMSGRWDFGRPLNYAFHVQTSRLETFLKDLCLARGVKVHPGELQDVNTAGDGRISTVRSTSGDLLSADLYIDCSGSSARLCGEELGVEWASASQWLLCDATVSMRIPYDVHYPGFVRPYTIATARTAGWIVDIPLQNSRSITYVYASSVINREEAERELRGVEGAHTRHLGCENLTFDVGHRKQSWVGNCVSIGQSNSCLESLLATDLHTVDAAAAMLAEHFPYGNDTTALAFRYNRIMTNRFYESLDQVNLHYALSQRTDSEFWVQSRLPEHINDRLQAKLAYWRSKPPTRADFEDQFFPGQSDVGAGTTSSASDVRSPIDTAALWTHENYEAVLFGMDFLREECAAWYGEDRPEPSVLRHVIERVNLVPQKLPPHSIWLQHVAGMANFPTV